ncbi:MAG: L-seryl-tRNA(Sec) selenium transferase, partial [Thermoanaerobaculia bacterium]
MSYPPSMDSLLSSPEGRRLAAAWGREALKEELRRAMSAGETLPEALTRQAQRALERRFAPTLTRVLNGTGVLLHTNLGRSPLCT